MPVNLAMLIGFEFLNRILIVVFTDYYIIITYLFHPLEIQQHGEWGDL